MTPGLITEKNYPDPRPLLLASASTSRIAMLKAAGITFEARPARIDEESIRLSLQAEGAPPRDMADTLAEMKARKLAEKHPEALVIGSDQILALGDEVFGKPGNLGQARAQLLRLRGKTHRLYSAVVVYEAGRPVWRQVGEARLTMREFTETWLDGYIARHQDVLCESVGGYRIEEEGVRLFSAVQGDHFTILGLPLVPLLSWLSLRGSIPA